MVEELINESEHIVLFLARFLEVGQSEDTVMSAQEGHETCVGEQLCASLLPFVVGGNEECAAAIQHRRGDVHARLNAIFRVTDVDMSWCWTSSALSIHALGHLLDDIAGEEHGVWVLVWDVGVVGIVGFLLQPLLCEISVGAYNNIGSGRSRCTQ